MIDYIKGELTELAPARAVIEAAGVGYELNISLSTYDELSVLTAENSAQSRLYVYEDVREDAWVLFGFASKKERELFIHLISVSGVGGNTARTILSSYSVNELVGIIANRQDAMLKRVKGIGGKTAQRIIVELEDKMLELGVGSMEKGVRSDNAQLSTLNSKLSEAGEEAIAALTMLGFSPAPSKKVVKQLLEKDSTLKAEAIIKMALKMM